MMIIKQELVLNPFFPLWKQDLMKSRLALSHLVVDDDWNHSSSGFYLRSAVVIDIYHNFQLEMLQKK